MRGYTLLELMTVVALLGILSALSVTGLQPLVNRYRRQESVDTAAQLLVRARQRALETGRCHHVQVLELGAPVAAHGDEGNGLRILRRPDADCVTDPDPDPATLVEVERMSLPERMRVRPMAPVPIVFLPNGRLQGGAMVQLEVGREARQEVRALANGPVCVMDPVGGACP
jgi:prepilin-type N-terminal cleavage/methylation domain-containing protein